MKALFALLVIFALLIAIYTANLYVASMSPIWQEQARQALAAQKLDAENAAVNSAQRRADFSAALRMGYPLLALLIVGGAITIAWVIYDTRNEHRARAKDGQFALQELKQGGVTWLVDPNKSIYGAHGVHAQSGQLLTDAHLTDSEQQVAYAHAVQRTRHIAALGPSPIRNSATAKFLSGHYERGTWHDDPKSPSNPQQPALPNPEEDQPTVPDDFWSIYNAGLLPQKGFLIGYDITTGQAHHATWQGLYSTLVGGTSGSGKSTLIRLLLAQSALQRSQFVVVDPHYGAGEDSLGQSIEPLRPFMLCDIAHEEKQIVAALRHIQAISQRRLRGQDPNRTPMVLIVDETTALLQRSGAANQLLETLANISEEARKVGVYALCIGQNFSAVVMETSVRNAFASYITCRARRDVARIQSGNTAFGQLAEKLALGQAAWLTPNGDLLHLAIPNTTAAHIRQITANATLPGPVNETSKAAPTLTLPGNGPNTDPQQALDLATPKATKAGNPQAMLVLDAFVSGKTIPDIVREIYGHTGGRNYNAATFEVQNILRSHLAQK